MIGVLVVLAVVVALVIWRGRRRAVLAGRDQGRPTYTIEPPGRRVGVRRTEGL